MITLKINDLITGYHQKNKESHKVGHYPSLSLSSGDFVALIGRNGIGKSTLLKTLSGDLEPLSGEVLIDDQLVHQMSNVDRSKLISFVLPNVQLNGRLTAKEVVMLGRYPYINWWGKSSEKDLQKVNESLDNVNASHLKDRDVNTLSDGERQKVMIARALAQDTPIIFLDESTAHLDLPNRVEIFQLLKQIARKQNKTILLSTHEIEMCLQVADYLWLLQESKCIYGTPDVIIANNNINEVFNSNFVGFDTKSGVFNFCSFEKRFSFGIKLDVSKADYIGSQDLEVRVHWLHKKLISEGCVENDNPMIHITLKLADNKELLEWHVNNTGKEMVYQDHNSLNLLSLITEDFNI
ncbi:ABC transporter ATP-binding protein [Flammeovirga pacifica]|uniref:ABC transporter domain-containing protein n=1 Tax=Flammeovirga pacifica TaxID=915059 RepID=A0A1S1YWT7_FLAPC|nr:ABC transporter ATP-binding protein [Flammeovirga pacifica]OHX65363.1 hypothetical protein NH26_02855 [Flammeovirga pacifica]